jgi:RHS repeat-associated protein
LPTPNVSPTAQVCTPYGPGSFGQSPTPNQREVDTAHVASVAANPGLAAPLSNSVMEKNSSDPVRDGELVVQESDVDLTAAGMNFRFQRTYRSRIQHFTALGWGWDFNYNRRILVTNSCGEVDLVTGDSGRVRFTVDPSSTATQVVYAAPAGVPLRLTKMVGQSTDDSSWELLDGDNIHWTFDGKGLLRAFYDPAGRGAVFTWQRLPYFDDPKHQEAIDNSPAGVAADLEWAIQYAEDNLSKKRVNFIYDDYRLACLSWNDSCQSTATLVTYAYKGLPFDDLLVTAQPFHDATLVKVPPGGSAPPLRTGHVYVYDDPPTQTDTFLGDDEASAFCTSACGAASDCHATAMCEKPTEACLNDLSQAMLKSHPGETPPSDPMELFFSWVRPVCLSSMMYVAGCAAPQAEQAGFPPNDLNGIVSPYCDFQNPAPAGAYTCAPGIVPTTYSFGEVEDRAAGKKLQPNQYDHDAAVASYSAEFCRSAQACDPAPDYTNAIPHACVALQRRSVSFCTPTCYDDCFNRFRQKDKQGNAVFAYGRYFDLQHNLKEIRDTAGTLIQRNEYGKTPADPSFDKVLTQQLGEDPANTITFYYVDLAHDRWSSTDGLTTVVNTIAALPDTVPLVAGATLALAVGAPVDVTATADKVYALTWKPRTYVTTPDQFKSVEACPASCAATKPKPVTRPSVPIGPVLSTPVVTPSTRPVAHVIPIRTLPPGSVDPNPPSSSPPPIVKTVGSKPVLNPANIAPATPDLPTRTTCSRWSYAPAWVGTSPAVEPQLPAHAVVVKDLHGVVRTEYYDANERVIREINQHVNDGHPPETTDYNYDPISGSVQGILHPDGQRTCIETNSLGATTQITQLAAVSAVGDATPQMTVFERGAYAPVAPALLTDVTTDPSSPSPAAQHLVWKNGRIATATTDVASGVQTSTQYGYDGVADGPRTITSPSGALMRLDDYQPSGPGTITTDSSGGDPIVQRVEFDSYGWPQKSGRVGHLLQQLRGQTSGGWLTDETRATPGGGTRSTHFGELESSRQPRQISTPDLEITAEYDGLGHRKWQVETPKIAGDAPRATCFGYGADGRLDGVLRPEGNLVLYGYDDANRLVEVDQGYAATLPDWGAACVSDLQSRHLQTPSVGAHTADLQTVRKLEYDASGHLVRAVDGSGIATTFVNDGFGRPIDVIDATGNHFRRGYDSRGRVAWEAAYSAPPPAYAQPTGLASSVPLLSMVEYQYDNLDRTTRVSRWHFVGAQSVTPGKLKIDTVTTYDDAHGSVSVSVDGKPPTVSQYDGAGRLISRKLPDGQVISGAWKETPTGDQATWTFNGPDGLPRTRIESYDDAGVLVQVQDGAGNTSLAASVDDDWREATRTVGGTMTTSRQYDAFGRVQSVTELATPSARTLAYAFDGNDRVAAVVDGNQSRTSYVYDGLDRLRQTIYPDGKLNATRGFIDGSGRPHDTVDAFGTHRTLYYDALGHLQVEHTDGAAGLAYGSQERAFTYDALGRVVTATMQGNTANPTNGVAVSLAYDSLGNRIADSTSSSPVDLSSTWDPTSGPVTTTLRSRVNPVQAVSVAKLYDVRGRLQNVSIGSLPVAHYLREAGQGRVSYGTGAVVQQPTFDTFARSVGVDVSLNGQLIASAQDSVGVDGIARERHRRFGTGPLLTDAYQIDGAGRLTAENLALPGVSAGPSQAYVSNGSVDSFFTDPTLLGNNFRFYQLDADSNWLSRTDAKTDDKAAFASAPSGWNQYQQFGRDSTGSSGVGWSYTAGNVTQIGSDHYSFDSLGQLVQADAGSSSLAFGYDALGRRILEIDRSSGAATTIVWDGNQIAAFGAGSNVSSYTVRVGGQTLDEHLALVGNFGASRPQYLHQTADGSVLATTNDAQLLEGYAYSAFGEVTAYDGAAHVIDPGSTGWRNPFLFQGQLYDAPLHAYAMRAREYRPDMGRFLSPDPMGIAGGENLYAFVSAKPLWLNDPFGLSAIHSALSGGMGWPVNLVENGQPLTRPFIHVAGYGADVSVDDLWRYTAPKERLPQFEEVVFNTLTTWPAHVMAPFFSGNAQGAATWNGVMQSFRVFPYAPDVQASGTALEGGLLGAATAGFSIASAADGGMEALLEAGGRAPLTSAEEASVCDGAAAVRYNPVNPGPLADDIAVTFRGGSYTERTLAESTTLYRVIGDGGRLDGSYWTATKPAGPLQSVIDSALDQNWGNPATKVLESRVPAGTTVFEGFAAPQRGLVGGGSQVYIPDFDRAWIVK